MGLTLFDIYRKPRRVDGDCLDFLSSDDSDQDSDDSNDSERKGRGKGKRKREPDCDGGKGKRKAKAKGGGKGDDDGTGDGKHAGKKDSVGGGGNGNDDGKETSDISSTAASMGLGVARVRIPLKILSPEFHCPVCLGYINNTRIVKECLHRFCGDCIQKCLRLGKKECPQCRIHIPSRRSLR